MYTLVFKSINTLSYISIAVHTYVENEAYTILMHFVYIGTTM